MTLLKCSAHHLCGNSVTSLVDPLTSSRVAPHNLKPRHVLGTRRFSLYGEAINHSKLLVQCALSWTPSQKRSRRSRVPRKGMKVNALGPIEFECQLSNICRGFPLVLSLCCSTRAGLLIINGASFFPTSSVVLEGPECSHYQFTYHGPHMNQSHLAELVIGRRLTNSPLDDISHSEAVFFSAAHSFDSSSRTWFGHTPVHTIKPELAGRIAELVSAFGVDDELAEYVEWKAHAVEELEREAWMQISSRVLPGLSKR
ncbi:hypothetical protein GH5_05678 [Leishmania sp. Ghana 2012 LV757]|uniref:hypothetical protein n=1 Tax=Leishmania sp. Ghana 2012 LV757 TaxID=2803181 RepID=UPI001B5CAFCD|nr:hypothetical protein GH5_05678 [Leishmania sp. Ghana 2012 LV757]